MFCVYFIPPNYLSSKLLTHLNRIKVIIVISSSIICFSSTYVNFRLRTDLVSATLRIFIAETYFSLEKEVFRRVITLIKLNRVHHRTTIENDFDWLSRLCLESLKTALGQIYRAYTVFENTYIFSRVRNELQPPSLKRSRSPQKSTKIGVYI